MGLRVRYPGGVWFSRRAGVRHCKGAGIPVVVDLAWGCGTVWLRVRYPGGAWIWHSLRGVDPAVCGSCAGLWPGAAEVVESLTEHISGSAGLWGGDLVGCLFFY
jgi:hypothetical protein